MPIKDTFPRTDRWDSVGLYCCRCVHSTNNKWPNVERNFACGLHNISLVIELADNNRLNGSWFCKNYKSNGSTNAEALDVFMAIKDQLDDKVLYRFTSPGSDLAEVPFEKIRDAKLGDSQSEDK